MDEQIHGLTLQDCADIMAKHGELRAQHGERDMPPHFNAFLAGRGIDENTWANGWNGWWARLEADPTGQLHAKYATMGQKLAQQAHMSDVPDASQDEKAGVTLEVYAKIMAGIAGGKDADSLLAADGVSASQWQDAQKGWNGAMAADVHHRLTTQYGALYAKYTPGFQANMEAQTAAIMAADHAERAAGRPDEPEVEYTFADMVREMEDLTPNTRWSAAHHVCNSWDIGNKSDPALNAAAKKAYELALDCLERHNEFTVSNAESLAGDLKMFASEGFLSEEEADDAAGAIARCLNRGTEHLATLEAAFAPIRDKAVPERITMQTQIQDYTSLVEELADIQSEWDDNYEAPGSDGDTSGFSKPTAASTEMAARNAAEGGFLSFLKGLPIIGSILRMLGM